MSRKRPRVVWRDDDRITPLRGGSEFFPAMRDRADRESVRVLIVPTTRVPITTAHYALYFTIQK